MISLSKKSLAALLFAIAISAGTTSLASAQINNPTQDNNLRQDNNAGQGNQGDNVDPDNNGGQDNNAGRDNNTRQNNQGNNAGQNDGSSREVTGQVVRKTNTRIVVRENNSDLSVIATLGEIRGRNNQQMGLDQIQVGDTVRAVGTMAGNSLKADSITVQ